MSVFFRLYPNRLAESSKLLGEDAVASGVPGELAGKRRCSNGASIWGGFISTFIRLNISSFFSIFGNNL